MNASSFSSASPDASNGTSTSAGARITKPSPLFPGCTHVETFSSDSDYEDFGADSYSDARQESYVTLDLGSVDQTLVPSSSSYRLIGLDTPHPYLQLSGTIMRGHAHTLLGTEMVFRELDGTSSTGNSDSDLCSASVPSNATFGSVRLETLVSKRLTFREVEVKPKAKTDASALGTSGPPSGPIPADSSSSSSLLPSETPSASIHAHAPPSIITNTNESESANKTSTKGKAKGKGKGKAATSRNKEKASAGEITRSLLYPDGTPPPPPSPAQWQVGTGAQSHILNESEMEMGSRSQEAEAFLRVTSTSSIPENEAAAQTQQEQELNEESMPWLDPALRGEGTNTNEEEVGMDIDS